MKRIFSDPFVIVCCAILLFFLVHYLSEVTQEGAAPYLEQIQRDYTDAENSDKQNIRKEKFTQALNGLVAIEEKYKPIMGDGKIYSNIGTVFFQLQEIPLAILNYYKALALRPRDTLLKNNLKTAEEKAGIQQQTQESPLDSLFFFHNKLSLPERIQAFSFFTLLAAASMAGYAWLKNRWLDKLALISASIAVIFLLSLAWTNYFSASEGVLTQSSKLFRGPGEQFAKAIDEPISGGSKVQILDASNTKWVKILTDQGIIGYVNITDIQGI